MPYFRRKKSRLWIFLVIIAVVLLSLPFRGSAFVKSSFNFLISPFIKVAGIASGKMSLVSCSFSKRTELLNENKILREKLEAVSSELNSLKEKSKENERLTQLLNFKQNEEYDVIPANVIGREPSSWFESVFIDKGTSNGVMVDMPVVTAQGLAGKVVETSSNVSKVLLIIDKNSKVGAMLQTSRDYGIIEGTSTSVCRLNYLSRNAAVNVNDQVISSGLGAVYPKGLVIGKVVNAGSDNFGLYKFAEVAPSCDFSKLEEVLVLKIRPVIKKELQKQTQIKKPKERAKRK